MEPVLRARGISQRFGARVVLDDVDLDVTAGTVIGLLGPNGAGKTTLMRILFGVLAPDAGTLEWHDRPVTDDDRRSWGYMPQERGLYRDMRVLDLLVWVARLHGLDTATARRRARALLEQLDLGPRERDKISSLSGGMAQRVQLAAAMVHGPDLLVLDEPFAGLDPVAVQFLSEVDHRAHACGTQPPVLEPPARPRRGPLRDDHPAEPRSRRPARRPPCPQGAERAAFAPRQRRGRAVVGRRAPRTIISVDASGTRLRLSSGADPGAVLDQIRRHAPVDDFGVETPRLSELFLDVAGPDALIDQTDPDERDVTSGTDASGRAGAT